MNEEKNTTIDVGTPTPSEIKKYLDEHVIGQDRAKKVLSVAIYNHFKKLMNNFNDNNIVLKKSNIIMAGETGSGKTLLIKTIAELIKVPCYIADVTSVTESGYVGDDCESILSGLLRSAGGNVGLAQLGIVVLDEVDKITKKNAGASTTRDVGGEGVQQALLKIVEGSVVGVPLNGGRKHPEQQLVQIDTSNILFIAIGAFNGLDKIIKKRLGGNSIGFIEKINNQTTNINEQIQHLTVDDLKDYGFIPEFLGRFPIITHVDKLTEEDLVLILTKPKNAIVTQYKALFKMDGVELSFTKSALNKIAKKALESGTGARGLTSIMENILLDFMYDVPDTTIKKLSITDTIIDNIFPPMEKIAV